MVSETVPVTSLTVDPSNLRVHGERNLETIKGSLARFGQQKPIVVDVDGVVVAGNGTLEAARSLGWETIEIVRSKLKGAEAVAFAIADNRSAELAVWNDDLAGVLAGLRKDEGVDELVTGFDSAEIDKLIERASGLDGGDPAQEPELGDSFGVLVECADEGDQEKVFERLTKDGYPCRVLTL